jgi:uncharacterized membrane protein
MDRTLASVVLVVVDVLWVRIHMKGEYERMVRSIQKREMKAKAVPAVLAYALMVAGLQEFVLCEHAVKNDPEKTKWRAFLFGVVLYGVYNLTAMAVLDEWDGRLAAKDILWGGALYVMASSAGTIRWSS